MPPPGFEPRTLDYSAALLPTELCRVLVTVQHLRVYGIVKKKKLSLFCTSVGRQSENREV